LCVNFQITFNLHISRHYEICQEVIVTFVRRLFVQIDQTEKNE